jgi:toxin ParE1/3/4
LSAEPARAVWVLDAAEDDIAAAFEWYESKRVGLGAEFVHAVDAVLVSLLDFPESREAVHRSVRRCLMGRFPFEIFYRLEPGFLVVVACMHAARDPEAVLRRIGG